MKNSLKPTLGEIADIHSGYLLKRESKVGEKRAVFAVQPRDVADSGRVLWPTLVTEISAEPQPVHFLKKNDVLFLSKMNPRPAYVETDPVEANTIASSHFFILRPFGAEILPSYLFWFLNQPETKKFIRSVAAGSSILNVKKSDLQDLRIDLPSLAIQNKISELARLSERYKDIQKNISEKTERLIEEITLKALKKQVRT